METIKVNMTPCDDVQTIHASQNDGEAREWGFILHNNGDVIDSSEITDQMVFKAYKGGTEQILPENGSVPVTAPFNGDIKYPQGLLTDQEFLYRESPTEEDGLAWIKNIKGNTLVWNQLIQNGNFADTSVWQNYGSTFTVSGNTATVKTTNASNQFGIFQTITFKANHKYFISFEAKKHGTITLKRNRLSSGQEQVQEGLYRTIETASADSTLSSPIRILFGEPVSDITNDYFMVKNYMIIDLTQMGLDSLTVEQFTSLFSKPYYDYCQGAMLSFGGRNVKFNQLVQNGNFADTSVWTKGNCTFNVSNNVLTFKATAQYGNTYNTINNVANHVCLLLFEAKSYTNTGTVFFFRQHKTATSYTNVQQTLTNAWAKYNIRVKCDSDTIYLRPLLQDNNASGWGDIQLKNVMVVDLTEMFGAGNEPSAEGFKELFPDDYYEYTTGQYMNIGQPVSLKTTGKNICKRGSNNIYNDGNLIPVKNGDELWVYGEWTYTSSPSMYGRIFSNRDEINKNGTGITISNSSFNSGVVKKMTMNADGWFGICYNAGIATYNVSKMMISYVAFTADEYEAYTESAFSIPLDEFPNGMDGINDVKDEKNETGYVKRIGTIVLNGSELWHSPDSSGNCWINLYAMKRSLDYRETMKSNIAVSQSCRAMNTTEVSVSGYPSEQSDGTNWLYIRLPNQDQTIANITAYLQEHPVTVEFELYNPLENYGVVDMGSLNWSRRNDVNGAFYAKIDDMALGGANKLSNLLCSLYTTRNTAYYGQLSSFSNMEIAQSNATQGEVYLVNTNYSDVATFKTAMSGVYLLYEKQNPQSFTTASLVTENGEIPLSNEDGVLIGKCTEQLSAEPGFHDAKVKLTDSDGDVYSDKIQLHVERKP